VETAEEKLLRKDKRGDTPLHAAACKAIDLAVRNRHQKCKNILAEYHLHYCTSSEFDSVLFLATLEVSGRM
jgi:hypothetical protein